MASKDNFRNSSRKDQLINEQRKKLEELRLQTESENTKLLKIQQKEREIESQYQNQRKHMEETLAKLTLEQDKFMTKQMQTTEEFEKQKEQIFANDRKKQSYLKQKEDLEIRNSKRKEEIREKEDKLRLKKQQLEDIRQNIKKYQIYEEFLREVKNMSDDFGTAEVDEFSVMSILERYRTMEKKKSELADVHKKIGYDKQSKIKSIQQIKKIKDEKIFQYNLKIKELKEKIDGLSEEHIQLESELEGQLNENGERQREFGQVIFSIRGLYLDIVGEEKQEKSIIEMLATIKEERRKLKEYLELYLKKIEENKKTIEKKEST